MGKGKSAPPPNSQALIDAQKKANIDSAGATKGINAVDVYGPGGSTTYTKDANGVPISQTTSLNPAQQAIYDKQMAISGLAADTAFNRLKDITQTAYSTKDLPYDPTQFDALNRPKFNPNAVPKAPSWKDPNAAYDPNSYGDINMYAGEQGDAIFNQGMSRLAPQMEMQRKRFEQQMADRGLPITGEAYEDAYGTFSRGQNDLVSSLNNQATMGQMDAAAKKIGLEQGLRQTSWNEAQKSYDNRSKDNQTAWDRNIQSWGAQNQDWQNAFDSAMKIRDRVDADNLRTRNQSIADVQALMGAAPQMIMPQAPNMANVSINAPDVAGISQSGWNQQNQYAQQNNPWNTALDIAKTGVALYTGMPTTSKSSTATGSPTMNPWQTMVTPMPTLSSYYG